MISGSKNIFVWRKHAFKWQKGHKNHRQSLKSHQNSSLRSNSNWHCRFCQWQHRKHAKLPAVHYDTLTPPTRKRKSRRSVYERVTKSSFCPFSGKQEEGTVHDVNQNFYWSILQILMQRKGQNKRWSIYHNHTKKSNRTPAKGSGNALIISPASQHDISARTSLHSTVIASMRKAFTLA